MKTLLLVFSQSGNTKMMAEEIKAGVLDAGGSCDIADLCAADPASFSGYDLVGIGCPVFYYKEPFNVADFIEAMPGGDGKAALVFITHGATPGTTLPRLWKKMAAKGFSVLGGHHTYADAFVPFYPHPTLTTGHPDGDDRRAARDFGKATALLAGRMLAGESGLVPPPPEELPGWWDKEAEMLSREILAQVMPRLFIDEERCIQCGTCTEACPVAGINPMASPPRIQEPCVFCYNCVKACPEAALAADWSGLASMVPNNYARYRKALEEAEARGEFRWLTDPDSLDLDDPLHMQKERGIKGG